MKESVLSYATVIGRLEVMMGLNSSGFMKKLIINSVREEGNISQVAREYGLHRSTLHRWLRKEERGESLEDKSRAHRSHPHRKDESVVQQLLDISLPQPFFGCKRLAKKLDALGIAICSRTVQNILNNHGLGIIDQRCERTMKAHYNGEIEIDFDLYLKICRRNNLFSYASFKGLYPGEILFGMSLETFPFLPNILEIPSSEFPRVKICLLYDFYSTALFASTWDGRMSLLESTQETFNGRVGSIYLIDEDEKNFADISWPGVMVTIRFYKLKVPNILISHFRPFLRDIDDKYKERINDSKVYARIQGLLLQKGDISSSDLTKEIRSVLKAEVIEPILPAVKEVLTRAVEDWNSTVLYQGYPTFGKSPADILEGYVYSENDRPRRVPVKLDRII